MFTRKDALEAIKEKFPETKTMTGKDYVNGGTKTWVENPELRLKRMIDLQDPFYDGLKEGGPGLPDDKEEGFRASVLHDYKNAHGLW